MDTKKVLYAEDDAGVRGLVSVCFERYLPEVNLEVFREGSSLEKRLAQGSDGIDLVLMDNNMPGIDGSDIIKKYAKLPNFEKIPFVLCYGGDSKIGNQAITDGAFTYLEKDKIIFELIPIVKRALKI